LPRQKTRSLEQTISPPCTSFFQGWNAINKDNGIEPEEDAMNLFSLRADICGESDEIVSAEKVPGASSELRLLLLPEPIF
jgi:hypothetical protein